MRRTILPILVMIVAFFPAHAQNWTPGYYLIYGNRDGSAIDVSLDSDIKIEVWAATFDPGHDPDCDCPGFENDSINFMHNPLASNDSIITARNGGGFYYPLRQWDDVSFLPPNSSYPAAGYTNQSILAFCDVFGGPNPPFLTHNDTLLIAKFIMHTTSDSTYLNQLVCPFMEGSNPANGGLLWGDQGGVTPIIPLQTFSCLHFVEYFPGDGNGSGNVDGLDVTYLVTYFKGFGPPPDPFLGGDANGDCLANGLDVIYLVAYLKGGPAPFLGNCH